MLSKLQQELMHRRQLIRLHLVQCLLWAQTQLSLCRMPRLLLRVLPLSKVHRLRLELLLAAYKLQEQLDSIKDKRR